MSFGGRRIYAVPAAYLFKPCEYGRASDGAWHGCTPNGHACNLGGHEIVEHADGAISVSPSIRVSNATKELWHGWLKHGVWTEC